MRLEANPGVRKRAENPSEESSSPTEDPKASTQRSKVPVAKDSPVTKEKSQSSAAHPTKDEKKAPTTKDKRQRVQSTGGRGSGQKREKEDSSGEDRFRPRRQGVIDAAQYRTPGRSSSTKESHRHRGGEERVEVPTLPEQHFKLPEDYGQKGPKKRKQ